MINTYIEYIKSMDANVEVTNWTNVVLKKGLEKNINLNQGEIEHILDYLCSSAAPKRLMKMSITQAKSNTNKWMKANQKKGKNLVDSDKDIKTIHNFVDGSKIVELISKKAYKREGRLMSHCLGGYEISDNRKVYSYRDKKNLPHATFEVIRDNNEILQIKGKGNGAIHPKYIEQILVFLQSIDQVPRPSEMKNLGYYHIDENHIEFIKNIKGFEQQTTYINGELYAY